MSDAKSQQNTNQISDEYDHNKYQICQGNITISNYTFKELSGIHVASTVALQHEYGKSRTVSSVISHGDVANGYPHMVSHSNTNQAQGCLTSMISCYMLPMLPIGLAHWKSSK